MSRTVKGLAFGVGAFLSVLITLVIAWMIVSPIRSYGATAPEAQVSVAGWLQLILGVLSSMGFSAATLWQIVRGWLEKTGQAAGLTRSTTEKVIDFAKVTAIAGLVVAMPDSPARQSLIIAGRDACDGMRDRLFPLPADDGGKAVTV